MVFGSGFFAVALVVAVCNVGNNIVAGQVAAFAGSAELIKLATQYGAPFAQTGLDRLRGEIFGNSNSTRSTEVIIFNKSNRSYKLNTNECEHGGFTTGLFPEHEIASKQSVVFGMQSHGFMTGVKCTTSYSSRDGLFFEVLSDNPYAGKNWISESHSSSLVVTSTRGTGNNNQVRWIIEDVDRMQQQQRNQQQQNQQQQQNDDF